MWASMEFAGRKGPKKVYGRLSKAAPWEPDRSGTSKTAPDVIWDLAESCFRRDEGSEQQNPAIPAAYTFLGQFVTHDITFDTRLDPRTAAQPRRNLRTPALDLDSVYGRGPVDQPYLYQLDDPTKFATPRTESGEFDLPRNNDGSVLHPSSNRDFNIRHSAVIGDPRNDENILVAQLHLAVMRFHNARVDELREGGFDESRILEEARKLTTWHYQWVLVHDFLRRLCGDGIVDLASTNRALWLDRLGPAPLLPFEFTLAALRFGHSMIGPSYHLNDELQGRIGVPIQMFQDSGPDWAQRDMTAVNSLEGQRVLPGDWSLQWDRFLDVGDGATQWAQRINPQLAAPLRSLPLQGASRRERSLPFRTLWRGYEQGLPSGQSLAEEFELSTAALEKDDDPLWLYVLREAAEVGDKGLHLGPLGSTLVGEVMIGLLRRDEYSYLNSSWRPTLEIDYPSRGFDLAEFLKHAGVPISAEQWRDDRRL
jgi:hypothetical protein